MSPKRIARKTLLGAAYVLYLLAIVVAVDYAFYWRYYDAREGLRRPAKEIVAIHGVTPETIRHLGGITTSKASSFVNFPPAKPAGVLRIGAFGGSYTYGDEVDEVSDYPDMLAEQIRSLGVKAEVINFGNSFHGLSQAYMIWDEIARRYDLDYVLLGPSGFGPERDLHVNHSVNILPYFLHSRFVIEGDQLRRIDVIGDTHAERFRSYFSFVPAWRYLRYDRGDPAFIAAVLPGDSVLGNPFYYDGRSERDEATAIQRRLLEGIVRAGDTTLSLGPIRGVFYLLRSARGGNAAADRGRQDGTVDFVLSRGAGLSPADRAMAAGATARRPVFRLRRAVAANVAGDEAVVPAASRKS